MIVNFEQVHNYYERLVFEELLYRSADHPGFTAEMLCDVACVALNRMPVRYVRHDVDLVFYMTERERHEIDETMRSALEYAFNYVSDWTIKRGTAS